MKLQSFARHLGVAAVAVGVAAGCMQDDQTANPDGVRGGPVVAGLSRADSCDDLLARIQADALEKLEMQADALKEMDPEAGGVGHGGGRAVPASGVPQRDSASGSAGAGGTGGTGGAAIPLNGGTAESGNDSAPPDSFSDTNVQVEGVDEADIVKTDGERIYLLHGAELFVLGAWPAEETQVLGSTELEGRPNEMFVAGDRAVVYSQVYIPEERDGGGTGGMGGIAPRGGIDCFDCYYGGQSHTKITLLDVGGDTPKVTRELYFEGSYVSARRHDTRVRTAIQGGFRAPGLFHPNIEHQDAWGEPYSDEAIERQIDAWQARVEDDIRGTTLDDWLPQGLVKEGDELVALEHRCQDYYVPSPGLTEYGMTNIVGLDLDQPDAEIGGAVILGNASEVYANHQTMLLAHPDWRWDSRMPGARGSRTALHLFGIGDDSTSYVASGFVPGRIHDQFSLDERDGVVRVATTKEEPVDPDAELGAPEWWQTTSVNQVLTLRAQEGELQQVGSTGPMAEGEQIYSTRYVGDRAYVVTFRRVDPLFVVDVSDASSPQVLGELKIPGFSDYMHPLDEDHLLTIGRNVDPDTARDQGLLLQIFDVSDPLDPMQTHTFAFEKQGSSEANYNHKAFTYFADRELLAFPFTGYGSEFRSSLEVFRVDVADGFMQLGSIDHTALLQDSCTELQFEPYPRACNYGTEVRRGLFIDDYVYSISYGGVRVHAIEDLMSSLTDVPLPAPEYRDGRFGGFSGGIGMGGTGGTGGGASGEPPPDEPMSADGGMAEPDPDA